MEEHLTPTPCRRIAPAPFAVPLGPVLVVGGVAILHAEVEIEEVDVEIGQDQPLADPLPDDAGHLVAVELDEGVLHLDLRHEALRVLPPMVMRDGLYAVALRCQPAGLAVVSLGRTA